MGGTQGTGSVPMRRCNHYEVMSAPLVRASIRYGGHLARGAINLAEMWSLVIQIP